MPAIKQEWTWNDFSGGEGDAFNRGPKGSFRTGSNLDNKTVDGGIKAVNEPTEECSYIGSLVSINPYANRSFVTVSGTTYKLYSNGAFVHDIVSPIGGIPNYNAAKGWANVKRTADSMRYNYGVSLPGPAGTGYVHRWTESMAGVSYNVASYSQSTITRPYSYNSDVIVCQDKSGSEAFVFAVNNVIYKMEGNEVVTTAITLPENREIVGITAFQDTYRVYYNVHYSNSKRDAKVAYWDGIEESFTQSVTYPDCWIEGVNGDGTYDYAVFGNGNSRDLYYVGGLQRQPLRLSIENSNSNTRRFNKGMSLRDSLLYVTATGKQGTSIVYEWGSVYRGQDKSLSPFLSVSSLGTFVGRNVAGVGSNTNYVYVFVDASDDANNGKLFSMSTGYALNPIATASVTSYPLIGAFGKRTLKEATQFEAWYDLNGNSNTITFEARIDSEVDADDSTGWLTVCTATLNEPGSIRVGSQQLASVFPSKWRKMELRATINSHSSSSRSPILYGTLLEYNDDVNP